MTALPPLADTEWPPEITDLRDGFAGSLNVYRVMAHHPPLLRAWADLRAHVVRRSALTPQQSEVVILRTGWRRGSHYEWAHHVLRGLDCGLSRARIESLRGPIPAMASQDALLAMAVDQLVDSNALSTATQAQLAADIGVTGMLDVIATVGFYTTLSFILNSFDVPVDDRVDARYRALDDHP